MEGAIYITAAEMAEMLGISKPYAYKLIKQMNSRVDWTNNKTIHDRIAQDIDDLFYEYECAGKFKLPFDVIDKIIENVKTTALRRFKS